MSKPQHIPQTSVNLRRTRKDKPGAPPHHQHHHHGEGSESTAEVVSTTGAKSDTTHHFHKKVLHKENTYKTEPDVNFDASKVEKLTKSVLAEGLKDERYNPATCKELSQEIAGNIMERVKTLKFTRYKIVAVVSIGSLRERPGMQFGSRCLWNQETDKFACVKYTNGSLFAVAMVYGLYYE